MSVTTVLIVTAVLALIPAYLAARKRRTGRAEVFAAYYLFGFLLLVAAIPAAIWAARDDRPLEDDGADVLDGAALGD